jgi:hypothetical protein
MPKKKRTPTDQRPKGIERNALREFQNSREQENHERLERLLKQIVTRAQTPDFGIVDALIEFEESRMVALSTFPPQVSAAVAATLAKCKVMGLIVERSAVLRSNVPASFHGQPDDQEEAVYERLRERGLSKSAIAEFQRFVSGMRRAYAGDDADIIEGDAKEIE